MGVIFVTKKKISSAVGTVLFSMMMMMREGSNQHYPRRSNRAL
jgi:hypothetical protein